MKKLKLLHVGCGPKNREQTTNIFNSEDWEEIRFDIDKSHNPDILGSMTDMSMIEGGSIDAVYSSHNIEHLFLHEAEVAIKEFYRVLKPSGYVFLLCPDIIAACKAAYENGPDSGLYNTNAGITISPIDVIYGWRRSIKAGNEFMAHKYGYSEKTLISLFSKCGFISFVSASRQNHYDIVLLATKGELLKGKNTEETNKNLKKLFMDHLK